MSFTDKESMKLIQRWTVEGWSYHYSTLNNTLYERGERWRVTLCDYIDLTIPVMSDILFMIIFGIRPLHAHRETRLLISLCGPAGLHEKYQCPDFWQSQLSETGINMYSCHTILFSFRVPQVSKLDYWRISFWNRLHPKTNASPCKNTDWCTATNSIFFTDGAVAGGCTEFLFGRVTPWVCGVIESDVLMEQKEKKIWEEAYAEMKIHHASFFFCHWHKRSSLCPVSALSEAAKMLQSQRERIVSRNLQLSLVSLFTSW